MKTIVLTVVIFALSNILFAQNPTYILDANDGWQIASNSYEFDIDLTWTNPSVVTQFEYAGGQYFFDFNSGIANSGTLTMTNAGSDLPANMQPRNPTVYTSTTPWQLRWAVNTFPGAGLGYNMPPNIPVKIIRARLQTNAAQFAQEQLNLTWRNGLPNPYTKLFAYVGTTNTDITSSSNHIISLFNVPMSLPSFSIESPLDNEIVQSNQVHFSWNHIPSSNTTYRLIISTDPGFSKRVFEDSTLTDTTKEVYIRSAGIEHYAIVYARNNGVYSSYSSTKKFKVGNNLPIVKPIQNDTLVLINQKIVWQKVMTASSYRLLLSEDSAFTQIVYSDSTITDTTKEISGFVHRKTYYCKISAKDTGNVITAISPVTKFRTVYPINLEVKCALQGMYNPLPGILNRKDSITVYLRKTTSPFQILDSAKVPIDTVSLVAYPGFKNATAGSYYVVVKHFNSIETWSKIGGLSLQTNGYPIPYDFTTSASQAYGNNMRLKGGKYCIYSGDVNQDGVIDGSDLSRIDNSAAFYQVGTRLPEDLDANGIVDADDFAIGDNNWYFITVITPMNMFDSENHYEESMQIIEP